MIKLFLNHLSPLNLEDIRGYLHNKNAVQMDFDLIHKSPHFVRSIYELTFPVYGEREHRITEAALTFVLRFWPYLEDLCCRDSRGQVLLEKQQDILVLTDDVVFKNSLDINHWLCDSPFYNGCSNVQIDVSRLTAEGRLSMLKCLSDGEKDLYCDIQLQHGSRRWLDTEIQWLEASLASERTLSGGRFPFHSIAVEILSCFLDCIYDLRIGSRNKTVYVQHDYENGYIFV